MRQTQELSADPRPGTGKGPSYQTRRKGRIPAVVYGGAEAPENVSVDAHTLGLHVGQGGFLTTLFMLDVAGKKQRVIPRQIQLDPVTDRPVHVDFMRLAPGAQIKLAIPVRFKGQESSPGLKRGGVLNIVRHEIEMLLSADNIPDYLEGDLAGLDIPRHAAHQRLQAARRRQAHDPRGELHRRPRSWRRPASSRTEGRRGSRPQPPRPLRPPRKVPLPKVQHLRRRRARSRCRPRGRRQGSGEEVVLRGSPRPKVRAMSDVPLLIAGLGNPGSEYARKPAQCRVHGGRHDPRELTASRPGARAFKVR